MESVDPHRATTSRHEISRAASRASRGLARLRCAVGILEALIAAVIILIVGSSYMQSMVWSARSAAQGLHRLEALAYAQSALDLLRAKAFINLNVDGTPHPAPIPIRTGPLSLPQFETQAYYVVSLLDPAQMAPSARLLILDIKRVTVTVSWRDPAAGLASREVALTTMVTRLGCYYDIYDIELSGDPVFNVSLGRVEWSL